MYLYEKVFSLDAYLIKCFTNLLMSLEQKMFVYLSVKMNNYVLINQCYNIIATILEYD